MFASDGTAGLDTELKDTVSQDLGSVFLALDSPIVEHQWMQVSIAGMKHVGDPDAGFYAEPRNFVHQPRQGGTRNDAILNDVIGRDPADRSKRGFAAFPYQSAFRVGLSHFDFVSATFAADGIDLLDQSLDLGARSIQLD